ncbi:putative lumazine-binding protein [Gillisia sp. Hel_I_86]|uniref:nuclear transport factor 2 family protein n=1 Tax=Gillisia sp. Hel_I_86 TaxID=1249981 RepID=UPI00119C3CA5|nr:nuclear transport factor 2 family protein [Gillisia sp. Hel_I_86]TVZ25264.1 putative lumazine-binding protein [Gillisia sp. Hel_I_86]
MRRYLSILLFFIGSIGYGQQTIDEVAAKTLIEDFFTAFHKQDTTALRSMVHPEIQMQSISVKKDAEPKLIIEEFGSFLKAISAIPKTTKFEEKIHSFKIQVDGPMANVSTPYSFFVNGELSHCGVNTFQLFKEKGFWKIVYLIDTRTKEGCIPE